MSGLPFSRKFTRMWWKHSDTTFASTMNARNIRSVQDQLFLHSHKPWHRVICNNWLGKPITDTTHVFMIESALRSMGHEYFFISRRGVSHASYGIQVWCSEPEIAFVILLHASPILHMRSYTPEQFEDQISTMLTWSTF